MVAYSSPDEAQSELGRLLLLAVPENKFGRKTYTHLAKELGYTRQGIQRWLDNDRVPPHKVGELVRLGRLDRDGKQLPESRVSMEDFLPFVIK